MKTKTATKKVSKQVAKAIPTKAAKPAAMTHAKQKMSQMDAALAVLAKAGEPMNCKAMELNETAGVRGTIKLTPDDLPTAARWWRVAAFVRDRGKVVFLNDVAKAFRINPSTASKVLAQAALSGRVVDLGHQKGWIASK